MMDVRKGFVLSSGCDESMILVVYIYSSRVRMSRQGRGIEVGLETKMRTFEF